MYERQVIYENFVERRAKVMIFDSVACNSDRKKKKMSEEERERANTFHNEPAKKGDQWTKWQRGKKLVQYKIRQKPWAPINKQTHSIIFERILIYHRRWREQRERTSERMHAKYGALSHRYIFNDFVGATMWLMEENNCAPTTQRISLSQETYAPKPLQTYKLRG